MAEVSAKRDVSVGFLRKQMEQAAKHGRRLRQDVGGTVYALVINGGRIAHDTRIQAEWLRFVEKEGLAADDPVRLVDITRVGRANGHPPDWQDLPADSFVHGCLTQWGA